MTPEESEQKRRKLVIAAHHLESNPDYMLLRRELFRMAPPLEETAFRASDGYNSNAAAVRDGASTITRFLLNLSLSDAIKEPEPQTPPKADFVG